MCFQIRRWNKTVFNHSGRVKFMRNTAPCFLCCYKTLWMKTETKNVKSIQIIRHARRNAFGCWLGKLDLASKQLQQSSVCSKRKCSAQFVQITWWKFSCLMLVAVHKWRQYKHPPLVDLRPTDTNSNRCHIS